VAVLHKLTNYFLCCCDIQLENFR